MALRHCVILRFSISDWSQGKSLWLVVLLFLVFRWNCNICLWDFIDYASGADILFPCYQNSYSLENIYSIPNYLKILLNFAYIYYIIASSTIWRFCSILLIFQVCACSPPLVLSPAYLVCASFCNADKAQDIHQLSCVPCSGPCPCYWASCRGKHVASSIVLIMVIVRN